MFPRRNPPYKILSFVLWLFSVPAMLWLWFCFAPIPRGFYLSPASHFTYERLLLPRFSFPGRSPKPEQGFVLVWNCHGGLCLVTPASVAARQPIEAMTLENFLQKFHIADGQVRRMLDDQVYGGSLFAAMFWPVALTPTLLVLLFGTGVYLDVQSKKKSREGEVLRGPSVMTVKAFNRTTRERGKVEGFVLKVL